MTTFRQGRRAFLKTGAAALAATALPRVAFASPKSIKIGLVAPQTGPLAIFSEQLPWTLEQIKAATAGQIDDRRDKAPAGIRGARQSVQSRTARPKSPRTSSCRRKSTS